MAAGQGKAELTADCSTGEAAALILTSGAQDFGQHLAALMASDDPEGPHKSRVALRRLRAALQAFAPVIAPAYARKLKTRLKALFREIGRVRDADVLAQATACHPEPLQARADKTRRKVRKHLLHDHADRFAAQIERDLAGKDWRAGGPRAKSLRQAPVTGLAAGALDGSWDKLLARGADLAALAPAERHELRKHLKTFRYLAEYFTPLWPQAASASFLADLGALQDDLGALNDLAMARARGVEVEDAHEAETLRRAGADWSRLAGSPRWWRP